ITRMVENQRVQMGTLKALGYGDGAITRHYMSYAFFPSLAGALLGLAVGRVTLPYILWDMEAAHYILPYQLQAAISWEQWAVCALAVVLACGICLRTYRKSAREVTAALLRPKPPKEGSRLLLERIPGLWKRFGFNTKMVARNLMRSKARTVMSLIGVLCCNMLIITSFGLQDSVKYFVGNYYNGTLHYDVRADLTAEAGELSAYRARIGAERVDGVMEKTVSLRTGSASRTTMLTVLEEEQQSLRLGANRTVMALAPGGVTLTRKLADVMEIELGQSVQLWLPGDDEPIETTVTGVADVNIGQGAYMLAQEWERLGKGAFTPTALLVTAPTDEGLRRLNDLDELDALKYPAVQYGQTFGVLQSMTGVFSLMSGAALGLAFVVLYNMGILNFMERYREYATLKVLGYHQREIRRLMTRENNLITLLGLALGVAPGWWLTAAVLKSCESSEMVYESTVALSSIAIACVVTYLFSCFVQWLLTRKVRTIDMVEALKSVE
ncbi:MAG: ABC transporter permease, partial [Eubacteriales bacterium]|nr:ABC transporter permease [Eubacteriales bacterium]